MRQVMLIVNPKAGKGNAKANLFTLCNAFCAMEDEVKVFEMCIRDSGKGVASK